MSGQQHPIITGKTNQLVFAIFKAALSSSDRYLLTEDDKAKIEKIVKKVVNIPENNKNIAKIGFYAGFSNIESKTVRQYAKKIKKEILAEIEETRLDLKTAKITNLLGLVHGAMRWLWFFHPHDECDDITFVGWYRVTAEKQLVVLEAEAKNNEEDLFSLPTPDYTIEDIKNRSTFIQFLLTAQDYRPEELEKINTMMTQLKTSMCRLHNEDSRKKHAEQLYLVLYYYSNLVRQLIDIPPLTRSA